MKVIEQKDDQTMNLYEIMSWDEEDIHSTHLVGGTPTDNLELEYFEEKRRFNKRKFDRDWVHPSVINRGYDTEQLLQQWETSYRLVLLLTKYLEREDLKIKPIFNSILFDIKRGSCITKKQFDTTTEFLLREKPYKNFTYTQLFKEFQWVISEFLTYDEGMYKHPLFHSSDPKGKEYWENHYKEVVGDKYVPPNL